MCFHGRVIFSCGHSAWLGIVRPCVTEQQFENGERDEGCSERKSHPYRTVVAQVDCKTCRHEKSEKTNKDTHLTTQLSVIKAKIKSLRENLDKRRPKTPETGASDTPETPATPGPDDGASSDSEIEDFGEIALGNLNWEGVCSPDDGARVEATAATQASGEEERKGVLESDESDPNLRPLKLPLIILMSDECRNAPRLAI